MNFRLPAILFGAIFALGVVLLILSFRAEDPATGVLAEELSAIKPAQIDTLELEREDGARVKMVRVEKDKSDWKIVEPYTAKADAGTVNELITALLKAKPISFPGLTSNAAVHGLQPPGLRVTLRSGDKASTINFGEVTIGEGGGVVFVTTSARSQRPMATSRQSVEPLFRASGGIGKAVSSAKWLGDFRAKQVFSTERGGDDVTGIALSTKNNDKKLSLAQAGRGWKFVDPPSWGDADPFGDMSATPGTFTGVRPLIGALTSLQALAATDFIDNPSPQDLEKYGLNANNPETVKVELLSSTGKTVAYIGKKDAAEKVDPKIHGMMPLTGKWWVRVEGQQGVIRANAGDLSGLASVIDNPDPLRDRNLLSFEKTRVDGLDLANGSVKLRKVGGQLAMWKLYGNPAAGDPQIASMTDVERIVNLLTERRTIKSFPTPNDANFTAGAVVVKIWADGFEANTDPKADPKAEPKEKGKPVILTFGKKEGDLIHVRRELTDGTKGYFLLPDKIKFGPAAEAVDLLANVSKTRLDFLDKDLKPFSTTTVSKLTVMGAATFDLDRAEPATGSTDEGGWKFAADAKGSAGQVYKKGETADTSTVQGMLDILATTPTVTRYVDETPTPEKLVEYGLGTATKLRVIVGLKGTAPDDKERVFEFGKETADPNFVYAQQRGKQAVFTLPKFIYDKFPNADLRNKAIFRVNQAEVAKIEITGWGDKLGAPAELVLAKDKDGNWSATKAPTTGYMVDPNKVRAFLNMLNGLQVQAFTGDNAMEPKHNLGDPKVVFVVTLANAAGAHHLHLRLGGMTDLNGLTLYAFTNRVPDGKPIVTVDAAPFKAYKEGPAAFAR